MLLGEISDKIPCIETFWIAGLVVGLLFFCIARSCRPLAGVLIGMTLLFANCSYREFVADESFADAVRHEMGVAYQITAVLVPSLLALMGAVLGALHRRSAHPDATRCLCGYKLAGNASGHCPECGSIVLPALPPPPV